MKNAFTIDYKNATPLIIESSDPVNIPAHYGMPDCLAVDSKYRWGEDAFPILDDTWWVSETCLYMDKGVDTPSVSVLATISMIILVAFSQRRRLD